MLTNNCQDVGQRQRPEVVVLEGRTHSDDPLLPEKLPRLFQKSFVEGVPLNLLDSTFLDLGNETQVKLTQNSYFERSEFCSNEGCSKNILRTQISGEAVWKVNEPWVGLITS